MTILTTRDKNVITDLIIFEGLFSEAIKKKHFNDKNYAWERLGQLYNARYLDKKSYYVPSKDSAKKKGTMYFATPKGAQSVNKSYQKINTHKSNLKKQFIISNIYQKFNINKISTPDSVGFEHNDRRFYFLRHHDDNELLQELKQQIDHYSNKTHFIIAKGFSDFLTSINSKLITWKDDDQAIKDITNILSSSSSFNIDKNVD